MSSATVGKFPSISPSNIAVSRRIVVIAIAWTLCWQFKWATDNDMGLGSIRQYRENDENSIGFLVLLEGNFLEWSSLGKTGTG